MAGMTQTQKNDSESASTPLFESLDLREINRSPELYQLASSFIGSISNVTLGHDSTSTSTSTSF